jgi:outer membrane protein TolC
LPLPIHPPHSEREERCMVHRLSPPLLLWRLYGTVVCWLVVTALLSANSVAIAAVPLSFEQLLNTSSGRQVTNGNNTFGSSSASQTPWLNTPAARPSSSGYGSPVSVSGSNYGIMHIDLSQSDGQIAAPATGSIMPMTPSASPATHLQSGYHPPATVSASSPSTPVDERRWKQLLPQTSISQGSRPAPLATSGKAGLPASMSKAPVTPGIQQSTPGSQSFTVDFLNTQFVEAPEGALPLGLMESMQMALQNHLAITIADIQRLKAGHARKEAVSSFLPDILLNYRQSRFQGGVQVFNGDPFLARITNIQPEARVRLPVNLGGEQLWAYKGKAMQAQVKAFAVNTVKEQSLLDVGEQYLNLLDRSLALAISGQSLAEAKAQQALSQGRYDEGVGVMLDVLQSQTLTEQEARRQVEARQGVSQANIDLNINLGLSPDVRIAPQLDSVLQMDVLPDTTTLASLDAYAMAHAPRLMEAKANVRAQQFALKESIAKALPTVTFQAYINMLGNQIDNLQTSRFAGLEVTMNILEGLGVRRYQQVKQAQKDIEEALARLDQTEREVKANVARAFMAWQANQQKLALSKAQLATSEQARYQAQGRYEAGLGNYLEVLTAATKLQEARTNFVALVIETKRSQLRTAQAAGQLRYLVAGIDPNAISPPTVAVISRKTPRKLMPLPQPPGGGSGGGGGGQPLTQPASLPGTPVANTTSTGASETTIVPSNSW